MKSTEDTRALMNRASDRGWAALDAGEFANADAAYIEALAGARELGDRIAEAVFLSYQASAARGLGEPDRARTCLDDALALAEAEDAAGVIGHVCYLIAELECHHNDESSAISWLWRALDGSLEAGDAGTAEVSLGKLGEIYRNRGWLEQASECFRQAAEIAPQSPNIVAWYGNLGQCLAEMQDTEGALDCYKKALAEAEQRDDLEAQSRCLASEGLALFEQNNLDDAAGCLNRALDLARKTSDQRAEAAWLGNISNVLLRQGKIAEAEKLCIDGLELARKLPDKRIEAAHCDTLGECRLAAQDAAGALDFYNQAATVAGEAGDHLGRRVYVHNQGRALRQLGQMEEAYGKLTDACALFEEQRGRIHSDTLKTAFAEAGQQIYKDIIELCLDTGRRVQAVEYAGRAKSRAMLDLLANSPIDISELAGSDDQSISRLVAKEIELRSQIAGLERMFGKGIAGSDATHRSAQPNIENVPRLYKQWREVVDQLRRRHPGYASLIAVDTLSFSDVQNLWGSKAPLAPNTAILEFFWSESFLLTAGIWQGLSEPKTHTVSAAELAICEQDLLDFLEMSATEGWTVPTSLCKRLYDTFVAPIIAAMPTNVTRLLVVPHGPLHRLPFAALHDGEKYLIERFALSVIPSASLVRLLRAPEIATDDQRYLVSAISDYSATRDTGIAFSSRLRSSAGLEDLSYTLEEGKTVFGLVSNSAQSDFLTNDQVKDGLLNHFRDYSVIHFAGHAVFNPEEPLASGLVLADGSVLTAARILADSTFRTDRGKLLVLSACQTGVNVITTGGEIIGLARALIYAGMRNLISSLWEVADRSTAKLMQDFHLIWKDEEVTIAGALRKAQIQAIAEGQPIHAWAPFIHMGID